MYSSKYGIKYPFTHSAVEFIYKIQRNYKIYLFWEIPSFFVYIYVLW